jgi:phosphatidylinositol alpha-1,6-mannosyltransferase
VYLFALDYPPHSGGIARLCSALARELQQRGALEQVVTAKPGWVEGPRGIREHLLTQRRGLQELQALSFLKRARPRQVICARWWPEGALTAASGISPVILAHGSELLEPRNFAQQARAPLRRIILEGARVVLANSRFTASLVESRAPKARCRVIPLAVDHERFSPGDREGARRSWGLPLDRRIVLTVARVQENKGHETVLRALASLSPTLRGELLYAIAGTGPSAPRLRQLTVELGVSESVAWLGHVPEPRLPDLYRAAELHLLVSDRTHKAVEGFGLVCLEAQACGVPALGADSGGIPDAVREGAGGFIVPAGDVMAVRAHLLALVENPERYRAQGELGRARVLAECTWKHYADAVLGELTAAES